MVQQCGHFFVDKVATVATVGFLGTAAVTVGALSGSSSPSPAPQSQSRPSLATASSLGLKKIFHGKVAAAHGHRRPQVDVPKPVATTVPAEPTEAPPPAEVPAEDPPATEPTDAPPADNPGQVPPSDPEPSPSPAPLPPPGFAMEFSVDGPADGASCSCAHSNGATSSSVAITSAGIEAFDQVLDGTAAAGDKRYGLSLHHSSSSGTSHAMDFKITTPDGGYFYSAQGQLVDRTMTDWNGWQYTYGGTYRLTSRPGGGPAMPQSGTYTVTLSASWEQNRVVSSSFALVEGNS
jgi:YD repeat-containing protein